MNNDELLTEFLKVYSEFNPLFVGEQAESNKLKIFVIFDKVKCLYTQFKELDKCDNLYPFLMLVAHYFVMGGNAKSINILPTDGGLVASSSVGDVAISYGANPYGNNEFLYWLALTPYGKEYLAWIKSNNTFLIVN